MLTIDDIRSIPLFSALADAELERLAQTSADVHLSAGEFAVPEGGDRALYAVLSGKIEVVRMIDGIERRLGWRAPGSVFGEVPMVFGTAFIGGYRAAEPSRVVRVDPKQYYAVAAVSPGISVKVGELARERIGAAGHCGRTVQAAGHNGRSPLGRRMQFVAQLPRAQPDQLRVDHARRTRLHRALARPTTGG